MKFVPLKSQGVEVFVNPEVVFLIAPAANLIGRSSVMSITGVSFEVEGSPSEVTEKLAGKDKPFLG